MLRLSAAGTMVMGHHRVFTCTSYITGGYVWLLKPDVLLSRYAWTQWFSWIGVRYLRAIWLFEQSDSHITSSPSVKMFHIKLTGRQWYWIIPKPITLQMINIIINDHPNEHWLNWFVYSIPWSLPQQFVVPSVSPAMVNYRTQPALPVVLWKPSPDTNHPSYNCFFKCTSGPT